jgi:hypothetical protein
MKVIPRIMRGNGQWVCGEGLRAAGRVLICHGEFGKGASPAEALEDWRRRNYPTFLERIRRWRRWWRWIA